MMKGIDVAKWNGNIDWAKVKKAGVEFAVLKVIDKSNKTEASLSETMRRQSQWECRLMYTIICIP